MKRLGETVPQNQGPGGLRLGAPGHSSPKNRGRPRAGERRGAEIGKRDCAEKKKKRGIRGEKKKMKNLPITTTGLAKGPKRGKGKKKNLGAKRVLGPFSGGIKGALGWRGGANCGLRVPKIKKNEGFRGSW